MCVHTDSLGSVRKVRSIKFDFFFFLFFPILRVFFDFPYFLVLTVLLLHILSSAILLFFSETQM